VVVQAIEPGDIPAAPRMGRPTSRLKRQNKPKPGQITGQPKPDGSHRVHQFLLSLRNVPA